MWEMDNILNNSTVFGINHIFSQSEICFSIVSILKLIQISHKENYSQIHY